MKNRLKFIFNGDIYYSVGEVDKAIVDYIYKTESVGDQDQRNQHILRNYGTLW